MGIQTAYLPPVWGVHQLVFKKCLLLGWGWALLEMNDGQASNKLLPRAK